MAITLDPDDGTGWVFYWAHRAARGRGITTALVVDRCNWALRTNLTHRLELGYRVNNPASQVVAQKAGFSTRSARKGKFIMDGKPVDAVLAARTGADPWPSPDLSATRPTDHRT